MATNLRSIAVICGAIAAQLSCAALARGAEPPPALSGSAKPVLPPPPPYPSDPVVSGVLPASPDAVVQPQTEPLPISNRGEISPWRSPAKETKSQWYGGQTLVVDLGAFIATMASPTVGVGGYFLGAPITHLAHGNPGRAAGSLGLRVALPLVGIGVGVAAEKCGGSGKEQEPDMCGLGGAIIGGGVGILAASLIDAFALAYEDAPTREEVGKSRVRINGGVSVTSRKTEVVLVGAF